MEEELIDFLTDLTGLSEEEILSLYEDRGNDISDIIAGDLIDSIHDYVWEDEE